jgi:hypothetical protein
MVAGLWAAGLPHGQPPVTEKLGNDSDFVPLAEASHALGVVLDQE